MKSPNAVGPQARSATTVSSTDLRARFAARLSSLYGSEVPAYTTLVTVSQEVNQRVMSRRGADAARLGSMERVTAERHGAIRVGSPRELQQVSRVFGALGMFPCGFYDLRDAAPAPIPVVSTAFRPLDRAELAVNPFRVFTSVLVPEDRRFFDVDLEGRLKRFIEARELFPPELLALADRAVAHGELSSADADRYLDLATAAFALSPEPVDRTWYAELERVSGVAADIGGVTTTHINHLTPRVLDIDDLYASMQARGVEMIDEIQGPPRWDGPDVLLRQTSFRALSEPRRFRHPDGSVTEGALRVRFGEVEARGVALTPAGRDRFDAVTAEADRRVAANPELSRADIAPEVWAQGFPATERELCTQGLGFFAFTVDDAVAGGTAAPEQVAALGRGTVAGLVATDVLRPEPIVYEDFLPRSAAGIFASNLTDRGAVDAEHGGAERDLSWMEDVLGQEVNVPEDIYAQESAASLSAAEAVLGRTISP
ncbi:VOC family protein [Terrabacter sp. MAHUQ-38]|uniref:2-oxoadipate dioxygenase/decarboxylase n=1 Tax=unclassified Terrabacter TaxID=2630222 RepID=UPI00165DECF1|nr:VOC family protein [Terrabacter sp. MAHUQ-38]MBC9822187.1 VOC family protein [Terrabacter sp. MAHUQ-38]